MPAHRVIGIVSTVEHVEDAASGTVGSEANGRHPALGGVEAVGPLGAGNEQRELLSIPRVDRNVLDLDVLDDAADLGVTCTDHGRLTGDGDGLGNPSDGHADVDGETLTRGHDDRLTDPIGETREAHLNSVSPGVHRGEVVNPGGVGDDRDGESRVNVDQLDARAG